MRILENERLYASVTSDHGAELCSIYDKEGRTGGDLDGRDPAYWNRHAPVLFSLCGEGKRGALHYGGVEITP